MAGNFPKGEAEKRLAAAGIQRRGLGLEEAAAYVGLSAAGFAQEVAAGTMPRPMQLKSRRRIWDRVALDRAIEVAQGNPPEGWDPIMAAIKAQNKVDERRKGRKPKGG